MHTESTQKPFSSKVGGVGRGGGRGGGGGGGGGHARGGGVVRMNYLVTDYQTINSLLQNHEKGRVRSCFQTDSSLLQNNIMKMLAFMFSSPAIHPGYVTTSNYRVVIVSFGRLIASGVLQTVDLPRYLSE